MLKMKKILCPIHLQELFVQMKFAYKEEINIRYGSFQNEYKKRSSNMANFKIHRSLWNKEPSKIFNYVNTEITWNETETEKYTVLIKLKLIFSRFELSIFCKWTKTWCCEQTRNHSYQFLKVKALPSTPLQDQRKERGLLFLVFLGFF